MDKRAVHTTVSYLKKKPNYEHEKLYTLNYESGDDLPRTNISNEHKKVLIHDLRDKQSAASLEAYRFGLLSLKSGLAHDEFNSPTRVEEVYYPQVLTLLRKVFPGAKSIFVLEHLLRKRHATFPIATGTDYEHTQPTTIVHIDFTNESAAKTGELAFNMPPSKYSRLVTVNIWKPLNGPITDWPLALCDPQTVDYPTQAVSADVVSADRYNENSRLYYSEAHRWHYFDNMQEDEAVFFVQTDSDIPHGGGVPHTSFFNPLAPKDAKPRESIETRAFVYYS
ncbi:MAG: hypothetical protein M1820_001815 [Bogoriella megaspora]|nr:MAG: hypothetical protein M1820_001815 [Bogoriella megaspora]